jgi:UDP-N-acetylmuramate dehydrogenase
LENFFKKLNICYEKDKSIKEFTSFHIGGKVKYLLIIDNLDKLKEVLKYLIKNSVKYLLLGSGTNVLFNDEGFSGVVIINRCDKIEIKDNKIYVQSGAILNDVVKKSVEFSKKNLEELSGIPGTIGGAIVGNAGAYGKAISDFIYDEKSSIEILDQKGDIKFVNKKYFDFKYRYSKLKYNSNEIVLSVVLKVEDGNYDIIKKRVDEILYLRKDKHPEKLYCAGSYFKNFFLNKDDEKRTAAGLFLDKVGAKSISYNDAKVYEKHANFIINAGNAKAIDILKLAEILKEKVKKEFGIVLEEEVKYIKN